MNDYRNCQFSNVHILTSKSNIVGFEAPGQSFFAILTVVASNVIHAGPDHFMKMFNAITMLRVSCAL